MFIRGKDKRLSSPAALYLAATHNIFSCSRLPIPGSSSMARMLGPLSLEEGQGCVVDRVMFRKMKHVYIIDIVGIAGD